MTSGYVVAVAGSTGLVGSHLMTQLLVHPRVSEVHTLTRRPLPTQHARHVNHTTDFADMKTAFPSHVDVAFCALGTTMRKAGSKEAFRKIDHDLILSFARGAREAGATRFGLVSSVGASADARSFYLRTKGEVANAIRGLGFETLVLAEPSFLLGERSENRLGERAGIAVVRAVSSVLVLGLKKYRGVPAHNVAHALLEATFVSSGERVLRYDELTTARAGIQQ